jgi:hypothetical protein
MVEINIMFYVGFELFRIQQYYVFIKFNEV